MQFINLIIILIVTTLSFSVSGVTFKVGLLAPEGTSWALNLKRMAKEIKKSTNGRVKFKLYYGGAQGDEPDVLRKIRVGQLQGGIFTGKTLGDINGDVRVLEIPFTFFEKREKAYGVMMKMAPYFNQQFTQKGFFNLGFFEIGLVYFVSKKKTPDINSLQGVKIWSWEGDPLVASLINTMKLVSVPLALPDVLSSLSTGIVEAAYAPPLAILALQWNNKIKYLLDFPLAYSTGAFLIDSKKWNKVKEQDRKLVEKISRKFFQQINKDNVQENLDALAALKGAGIEFIKFSQEDQKISSDLRGTIIKQLTGKLFSSEAYRRFNSHL
ncbi:MAG: TRAP transporter substrate-binding protein DctP [Bdellovibrionales bacterium]|jgi:TRAP-type transport system periplasmic protein|nr:TRAP transporter substrate-binding protein DctP [Bdellovibrionales bacterium]MBT3526536.1 TRAP transporter substrate-binding protein DctP [Bdellovibrionales bacterium]MBT7669484.1 TRAP transporter substrate-binding protein DctP [Bdellovibrionales bacterium]MBT7767555.1 TRAP transporter substrate-binding protein DctP [Bdellovibrionales bacterium]